MTRQASFGFGTVVGTVWQRPIGRPLAEGEGWIWIVPSVTGLRPSDVPKGVCAILTSEPVSAYSHVATNIWKLGVPVLCGIDESCLRSGSLVLVDFDSGEFGLHRPSEQRSDLSQIRMSPGTLSVLAEIDALDDLSLIDGVQGIGILNIEDILKLGRENARLLLREISDRGYAQPAIRFFDQHPRLPADSVTLGFRGARLLGDRSVVNDFLHAVDALLLEEEPTVVLPMYAHAQEFQKFAALVSPLSCSLGVTIECPEAALGINQIVGDCAVVEVGLNDLTQFTLAWDRNSVNFDVMSSSEISHGVGILIEKVSECVADRRVQYSLGLDLRPSRELVERIGALGVAEISCPAVLASRWLEIMA